MAKAKNIRVVLPVKVPKRKVDRFELNEGDEAAISNIYVRKSDLAKIGNPDAIRVTIEPIDDTEE